MACFIQRELRLKPRSRGCHLITEEIVSAIPELKTIQSGLAHLFLKHTSVRRALRPVHPCAGPSRPIPGLTGNEDRPLSRLTRTTTPTCARCAMATASRLRPAPSLTPRRAAQDMETSLNRIVPEDPRLYRHTMEGPDDMPAHVKSSLLGCQTTVPSPSPPPRFAPLHNGEAYNRPGFPDRLSSSPR